MKDLYSDNMEKVSGCMDEIFQGEQSYKKTWAKVAKRNVAFANGDQNPSPNGAPIMVNNQPLAQKNDSRPGMYQTNEIEPIIRTLVSYMTRSKPAIEATAGSESDEDKAIARVAEKVSEAKYDLDQEYSHSRMAAFWGMSVGTVFRKDYWDHSLGYYTKLIGDGGEVEVDPETGEEMSSGQKTGNNAVGILTPMSVTVDHEVLDFMRQPYIGESYVMDVDWAREAFDQDLPGYTGKAKDIQEDGYLSDTVLTLEEMKFAVPYFTQGNRPRSKGKCLIREWCVAPNREFPQGRLVIKAGGVIVFQTPPGGENPYFNPYEPVMWHPWSCFIFEPFIGRFLGKSLVEQLVPLQMRLNEINGAILENANTLAKPNIVAAENQLKKGVLNGKGANIYTYRQVPGGDRPFVLEGTPLPSQFFNEKQSIIDQMVRIAGTNFVMQGQAPTGVSAASAINQLLENANTQQADMMTAWQQFHEDGFTKKLRLIHKFNRFPDQALNRKLRLITGETMEFQTKIFVGAKDLSDGIHVNIQPSSMIPKSQSAKNELYKELATAGVLTPLLAEDSPRGDKIRNQLLEKMSLEPLESEESSDYKKAKWENAKILMGEPASVSKYDIGTIHLPIHKAKIQDPAFLETASEDQIAALDAHIQEHEAAEQEKAMQAAPMPEEIPGGINPEAMGQDLAANPAMMQ